jgi:hypothetical protein
VKIEYTVRVDEHCYQTVTRDIEAHDYEGVLRGLGDVLDLHELRYAKAKKDAANREAERRLELLTPAKDIPEEVRDDGPHKNVYEYDGAFKCLDCHSTWGAISGSPKTHPNLCTTNDAFHL